MSKYIESTLSSGERIVYAANVSRWTLLPALVVTLLTWGLASPWLIAAVVRLYTTELAFTNRRVVAKFGLISRKTVEMKIDRIESIQVQQSLLGRLMNYGSLVLSGAGNPQAPVPSISNPLAFRTAFMRLQEQTSR